jgi:hypothetical protein
MPSGYQFGASNRVVLTYCTRRSVDPVPSGTVSSVL